MKINAGNPIKPRKAWDVIKTTYSEDHWRLLAKYRLESLSVISALKKWGIEASVHGSIARGDIDEDSDIDIIVINPVASHKIELALQEEGFTVYSRRITQATPNHTLKGHIDLELKEKQVVTFPLTGLRTLEREFYRFGGILNYKDLKANSRVPGCTKRLTLIQPIDTGHIESGIIGREVEVSKTLKVKLEIVRERKRVLLRRDRIGRTGIFINRLLREGETFESALKAFVESNPAVRRFCAKIGNA